MTRNLRWLGLWALALGLVCAQPWLASRAAAQESGAESQAEEQADAAAPAEQDTAAGAIPQASILARADDVEANLRRLEGLLSEGDFLVEVRREVDADADMLQTLRGELDRLDEAVLSTNRIRDLRVAWVVMQDSTQSRTALVQDRWDYLQSELQELRDMRERWDATGEQAVADEYPPELTDRINTTIARLRQIEGSLDERNSAVASLADRLSRQNLVTTTAIERIDQIAAALARGLVDREDTRWYGLFSDDDTGAPMAEFREAGAYWVDTLAEFSRRRIDGVYALAALFALLLVAAALFRRQVSREPPDDPAFDHARFVASRPLSLVMAFTLVSVRWVFPAIIGSAADLLSIVAVVPVLRLGAGLLHPAVFRAAAMFSFVYLINILWRLVPATSAAGQLELLLGTVAALVVSSYVAATWQAARDDNPGRMWRLAEAALWFGIAVLGVSFIAGAMGWIRMARWLTAGVVETMFAAVAWRVVYITAIAVLPFVIRAPLGATRGQTRRQEPLLRRIAAQLMLLFVLWRFLVGVLERFRVLGPLSRWLSRSLEETYAWGGLEFSLGSTLAALLILLLTPLVARVTRFVLREEITPRLHLPPGVDYSLTTLAGYTVWVVGLVAAATAAGFSGTQMTVLVGALGVGLGFGLQAIVNNFVSGLILMFERPLKVGDRVQTATHAGRVTSIGIRASTIRTYEGADVVVPNGDLITKEVINWTLQDQVRRVEVKVSLPYATRPQRVIEILGRVAEEHPQVLDDPPPMPMMTAFGDTALDFRLRAWVPVTEFLAVTNDLHLQVDEALREAGIPIAVPRREILMRETEQDQDSSAG